MFEKTGLRIAAYTVAALVIPCSTNAQQPRQYTSQDYAAAESFMPYNLNPLGYKGVVNAQWLDDGRFWYRAVDETGMSYVLVDPTKGTRGPVFDPEKMAALLKEASNGAVKDDARHLVLSDISLSDHDRVVTLTAQDVVYRCDFGATPASCKAVAGADHWPVGQAQPRPHPPLTLSPDKKLGAFIRDWNLWVRDLA